jgi:hypothetical protein
MLEAALQVGSPEDSTHWLSLQRLAAYPCAFNDNSFSERVTARLEVLRALKL